MRISDIVMVVMVIGLVFTIFALTVNDVKTLYPEENLSGNISSEYEYSDRINSSIAPLREKIENYESTEKGWKVLAGLVAVPTFIISFVKIMFDTFLFITSILTGFATELKIPLAVSVIVIAMVTIYLLLKMVEWVKGTSK